MICYCIKTLNVSISRVTDDVFRIDDRSILETSDLEEAQRQPYKLQIVTDRKEEVTVEMMPGGSKMFSADALEICELRDGAYCFTVVSCDRVLEKKGMFDDYARCMIEDMLIKGGDDDIWCECRDELERIEILVRRDMSELASQKYKALCRKLQRCGIHVGHVG